ncbi:MAG: zinc transporter ZntB [Gammaproteobacteria bacterium]
MSDNTGLLYAYLLDGQGGGAKLDWNQVKQWQPEQGVLWVHLEYSNPFVQQWVQQESGLDEVTAEALLAEETRPRSMLSAQGLLLTLRGINPNPKADPEDMVAVRMWSDGKRIITTRRRRLQVAADLGRAIDRGVGPASAGEFVEALTDNLVERMGDVVDGVSAEVDDLEELVLTMESYELRPKIAELRRHAIGLRRYLAPQREAVSRLFNEKLEWLSEIDRLRLRESADRTTRFVEDLDLVRERAVVVQEELSSRLSEKMDRTMYVLSMVAAIFLPLGFLTGLLGINVGGIPGADYQGSFTIFILILLLLVVIQIWLFKIKKWM